MADLQKPTYFLHPLWPLALIAGVIFQTTIYFIGVGYFGSSEAYTVFLWIAGLSILILYIIWLRANRKGFFAIDEEE